MSNIQNLQNIADKTKDTISHFFYNLPGSFKDLKSKKRIYIGGHLEYKMVGILTTMIV